MMKHHNIFSLQKKNNIKFHWIFICLVCFFCKDPGFETETPMKIFRNWYTGNSSEISRSLNNLVSSAKKSISCSFSDLDTGYALDLKFKSTLFQNLNLETGRNIINKRKEGVNVSLVFDAEKKCSSTGALFFQYPDFFLSDSHSGFSFNDIIKDCNAMISNISANISQSVKQNGLVLDQEIFFVNHDGEMSDNFCVFDNKTIWFSQKALTASPENKPAMAFVLESRGNPVIDEFSSELNMLKNKLTGSFKKQTHFMIDYPVYDSVWHIARGPQDKPLDYLAKLLDSAQTLHIYSSGFDFDLKNPVINSLIELTQARKNVHLIFSDTNIFSPVSFYQNFFLSGGYCAQNPDFCNQRLKYLNLKSGNEKNHIFLLVDQNGNRKTVFFNGNLNKSILRNSDTMLIEIDSTIIYSAFLSLWESISNEAVNPEEALKFARLPQNGDIIFSEIVWMGSVDNSGNTHTSDEAIEVFNSSNQILDLSDIAIACTDSSTGVSTGSFFVIPQGTLIWPRQYFTMAARQDGAFADVNTIIPDLSILNTTRECLMIDNRTPSIVFYPSGSVNGHYNDNRLRGIILDQVLKFTQDSWNLNASQFFSKTGLNTMKYNIDGEGVRSMERVSGTDGKNPANWHMNTFTPAENKTSLDYLFHTFTSLGSENSPFPQTNDGSVIVTEVHWMGSYDLSGTSNASDEFVEFYNRSLETKNIGGWIFGCSTDTAGAVGKPLFAFPYGTVIRPGQYIAVQKSGASAFLNIDFTLDFTLNNTITQCLLTDGNYNETVFQGSDSNGDGILSGHYDQPLFPGHVADMVSNRSSSFSALGLGLNNTATKTRRSCERINLQSSGNSPSNWKSNSIINPAINTGIYPGFQPKTFATPGAQNSF